MKLSIALLSLALLAYGLDAATVEEITQSVTDGHWRQARQAITNDLAQTNLDSQTRQELLFQQDRMQRMRLDFSKTREQAFQDARAVVPSITEQQFADYEKAGAVESMDIDGTRWYFKNAGANLFRVNPDAQVLKARAHLSDKSLYRLQDIREVIAAYDQTGQTLNSPKTWRVNYSISVKPGEVPPGEIIRAWLPFPHAGGRQSNIRTISSNLPQFVPTGTNNAIASVYFEESAVSNAPTEFKIVFEYTADAFYQPIDPAKIQPIPKTDPALAPFLGEEPPQIVFSDEIRKLSQEIVGHETNACLKARRIFEWSATHLPWAPAREYSTIESLPKYALGCGHGDCGIKTMTFMALCRFNGIPARWESGWTTYPVQDMHDWCEIYLPPYGWVPMDVTYGFVDSPNDREKWFYFGGIDAGRLVLNTDYQQPVYPSKAFYRSEIVDFQRGEVEWRGGNLYFNQWNWDFNAERIQPDANPGKRP
jgi:hypothetical protein